MPFTALGLGPQITKAVREVGYTEPTPIQTRAIPVILTGRDVIGIAQTGTGKTAAFVLPILQLLMQRTPRTATRRPAMRTLIVAPTRELVVQIEENVRAYAKHARIRCATVFGGVGEGPQIAALRAGAEIVIATPGRLIDLTQQGHVDYSQVEIAVLDEADRMLDMGFLPPIRQIVRSLPKDRQTLLFSATLSKEIEALTAEFQQNPQIVEIGKRSNPADTVAQFVYEVPKSRKLSLLLHLLQDQALDSVLVFSRTKHGADKIAKKLTASGINTATLHSNRSQNQRLAALKGFRTGTVRVLVATDIAARGIDVEGISHVVNFDFPPQPEDYVHRIGRTGRAQAIGDAISFVTSDDAAALRALEKFISRGIPRKKVENFDYTADDTLEPSALTRPPRHLQQRGRSSQQPRSSSSARPSSQNGRPSQPGRSSQNARPAGASSRPSSSRPASSSSTPSARPQRRRTW
ncbi:MAG TPA: DEAD/DEAH box helicase [Thermoanaerobaculia bacterium]|nr:DEAD/DEAH box helicase [Thermoanaerobaculia bacterium]